MEGLIHCLADNLFKIAL